MSQALATSCRTTAVPMNCFKTLCTCCRCVEVNGTSFGTA